MAKGKKSKKTLSNPRGETLANTRDLLPAALDNLKLDTETDFVIEEELSPRLLALQQQLERLDQDRYLLQREEPLTALNASATKTELSLQSLKKRLSEVRQQLYGTSSTTTTTPGGSSLANLAKSYFGGVFRGKRATLGFPGEGEAFDEGELLDDADFEFEVSESECYEEELLNDVDGVETTDQDQDQNDEKEERRQLSPTPADYEFVTKMEAELDAALDVLASPPLASKLKLEALKDKFATLIKQDRHWRQRSQAATRVAHNERIQRQLIEMELDKANAIKHRLESLCRDLHNENRRIKAEGARREELAAATAAAAAVVVTTTRPSPPTEIAPELKLEFALPELPEKEILVKENSTVLAEQMISLADLYLAREKHFAMLLRQKETVLMCSNEKADILASQLAKQTTTLESSTRRISALTRSEQDLKAQVRQYVEKFRQVEETLGKSNDLFGTFRAEMEQMGTKLARLERENAQLNSKCATLSRNIIEMADERTKQNASLDTLRGQKAKLEQLCRTLQAERNAALRNAGQSDEMPPPPPPIVTPPTVNP